MKHFLYGHYGCNARNITGFPLNNIQFDYKFGSGNFGPPYCNSKYLYRNFKNNMVEVVGYRNNIIEILII